MTVHYEPIINLGSIISWIINGLVLIGFVLHVVSRIYRLVREVDMLHKDMRKMQEDKLVLLADMERRIEDVAAEVRGLKMPLEQLSVEHPPEAVPLEPPET